MKPPLEQNYYELLEVPRDATSAELDRAYDRAKAFYGVGSIATYSLTSPEELKRVQDRIDEAYLILGDDGARAEYDARIGPPSPDERPLHREVRLAREKEAAKEAEAKARAESEAKAKAEAEAKVKADAEAKLKAESEVKAPVEAAPEAAPPASDEKPHEAPTAVAAEVKVTAPVEPVSATPVEAPPAPVVAPPAVAVAPPAPLTVPPAAKEPVAEGRPVTPVPERLPDPAPPAAAAPVTPPAEANGVGGNGTPAGVAQRTPAPAAEIRLDLTVRGDEKREARVDPGPPGPPPMEAPEPAPRSSSSRRDSKPPERVAPKVAEIPADAVFNGEFLRKIRETHGLSVQELSDRTKIGKSHLENIEADRYGSLPPQVYLRGFLMSYARELKLDPLRVSKSYLEQQQSKGESKAKS